MPQPSGAMILHQYLSDEEVFTGGWVGKVEKEPEGHDNTITFYDLEDSLKGRMAPFNEYMRFEEFSVRVRSRDYPTGQVKGRAVEAALTAMVGVLVTVTGYTRMLVDHVILDQALTPVPVPQTDKNQRLAWLMKGCLVAKPFPVP